jgi:dephospho-CoA kinase
LKIIGLTGPSGAGKGELGAYLEARGVPAIDTDRVYHDLLVPPSACLNELVSAFGSHILSSDGTLDRTALAALVFAEGDEASKRHAALNRITHRHVIQKTNEMLEQFRRAGKSAVVIDAPLLIEAGMDKDCDLVVAVLADRAVRLERLMARDGKDRNALLARIEAQPSDTFYRAHADVVIENNGDASALSKVADDILRRVEVLL